MRPQSLVRDWVNIAELISVYYATIKQAQRSITNHKIC